MTDPDPLDLGGLEPRVIEAQIAERDTKKKNGPSELEMQKEARLAEKEKRLRTPSAASSVSAKAPSRAPPPPPEVDKSLLLDKITAYRERFTHLKKRNNVTAKSTADELTDELHYIETQLGANGNHSHSIGAHLLVGTMKTIEVATTYYFNPLGLDLTGLSQVTAGNMAEFQPIIDELMIKYNAGVYTSPEMRLALTMGATIMTVHAANNNPRIAHGLQAMNEGMHPKPEHADL